MKQALLIFAIVLFCSFGFAQATGNYTFAASSSTYTEISGGTSLGNETTEAQRFVDPATPLGGTTTTGVGFPIGFNFYFNSYEYDRLAVCADGWISLGQSWLATAVNISSTSYTAPLGSITSISPPLLVGRVAGMAANLQAQTGASLRIETIGSAPNRTCVVQWKNYRKNAASGDSYNFQIRLEETTNKIVLHYGTITNNATSTTVQAGFRAEPATDSSYFRSRTTTTDWSATTESATSSATCTLSSTVYPASGTTFTWTPPSGIVSSYSIGTGGDYLTFTSAINYLNTNVPLYGIPQGGVTFNVISGQTFTEDPPAITVTGGTDHPIVFQKSGFGTNPLVKAAGTTATTDAAFRINGGDYITFDGIDISNTTSTTALEYGYYFAGQSYNGCHSNTVSNCTITLSRTNTYTKAIYLLATSNGGCNDNTFDTVTVSNSYSGIQLAGNSSVAHHNQRTLVTGCVLTDIAAYGVYNSYCSDTEVENTNVAMAAGNTVEFRGIYTLENTSSITVTGCTVTGNTTNSVASGIFLSSGTSHASGNEISGFVGTGTGARYGIYINDGTVTAQNNEIHDITGAGHVYGLFIDASADNVTISGNNIYDIASSATTGYTGNGIYVDGSNVTLANNIIYDISSTGNTAPQIRGIVLTTGTTYNLYYNTIFLKGGSSVTGFSSAGIYITGSTTTLDLRNNIVEDLSTPGSLATARAVALWKTYSGFANFAATTDRNIYYAGTPGSKNLICYDNGTAYQTLNDYKTAVGTIELGSQTENVPFVSTGVPYDLHIRTDIGTRVEGGAAPISGWDEDFDGDDRDDSTPDIGADEGDFMIPALPPDPALIISPTDGEIVVLPAATLNWTSSSGGGLPTGYKLWLGTDNPPTNVVNGLDLGNATTYDPSPDMAFLTTYYWKVVPYNASGDATGSVVWSFETHAAPLTGSYTIGSTGYYPSFTLAITHLNAAGVGAGGVTYLVASGETFDENPPAITASGTSSNPITFISSNTAGTNPLIRPAGGTSTFALRIDGGDYITIDHLNVANRTGVTTLENGIWIRGVSGNGPNFNTIQYCNITLNRAVTSSGIYMTGASGSGTYTGNSFLHNAIDNATRGICLAPVAEGYSTLVQYNDITNATDYGIYVDNTTDTQILDNTVSFPASTTESLVGIRSDNGNNIEVARNIVSGGTTTSYFRGLSLNGGDGNWHHNVVSNVQSSNYSEGVDGIFGNGNFYNNEFYGLRSLSNTVYGMELSFENGGGAVCWNNKVHDLSSSSTSSQTVQGILSNGTNNKFYNNMIYDLRNPSASSAPQVIGINVNGRTGTLYNNTILLDATGTAANHSTAGLYLNAPTQMINNIVVNTSTPGASGKSVGLWMVTDFADITAGTNNNIWFAGTPASNRLICFSPAISCQTLDDYKAAVATVDQNCFTEDVPFASAVSPYDMHIDPAAATIAESNGITASGVTTDIDGDIRFGQAGYAGTGTALDIGADEGDFDIPALVPAPAVLVAPLDADYAQSINTEFTWYASGSGGAPTGYKIYFGSDNPPSDIVNGLDIGNVLTFTSPVTLNYLTTYYWQIVPYNENGPATGCPVWSYSTHQIPLTGNWIIGSSGYYPDFTHAIRYLNASGIGTGGATFLAISGEVFAENPPAITATGTLANPITFTSTNTSGTNPKITPTGGTDTFGLRISSGDFITIDHIDIANAAGSTTLANGIWIISSTGNGCTDITVQNCTITLNRTYDASTGIRGYSTSSQVNHRQKYLYNTIDNARNGIYLADNSPVQGMLIQNNVLTNIAGFGIYTDETTNLEISGNNITFASSSTWEMRGIFSYDDNGTGLIHHNNISGGSTSNYYHGIYVYYAGFSVYNNTITNGTGTGNVYGLRNYAGPEYFYDNTISGLTGTSTATLYGIYAVNSSVYGNEIFNLSANYAIRGINLSTGSAYRNKIYGLNGTSTYNVVVHGIYLTGTASAYNNMVYDLRNPASSNPFPVRGIAYSGGNATIEYNSVLLTATGTAATFSSAGIYLDDATSVNLSNNLVCNLSTAGTSGKTVALGLANSDFTDIAAASNNNIWYAGTPGTQNLICYYGTTSCPTLDDYKTANLGKDQNSFTENPPFVSSVSPFDLHLNSAVQTYAEGNALPISGITTDFDSQTRNSSTPDIGADEGDFTPIQAPPATPSNLSPANASTGQALNVALAWAAGSGGGMPDYYNVYFGTSSTPPLVQSGVTATSYSPASLLPNTTYYWKVVAVNDLGSPTGAIWSFTTRNSDIIMEFPFTESFESGNTHGSTTIFNWTQALGSGANYWTGNTATSYNRTPRTGSYNVTLAAVGDTWLFRPIYLTEGQMYSLEFWARQYNSSGAQAYMQVRLGTGPSAAQMTSTIVNIREFINGAYQSASGTFTGTADGIMYLGFHGICSNATNYFSLDDISINYYTPSPVLSAAPESWNFGMIDAGTAGSPKAFVITNTGDANLSIGQSSVFIGGTDADQFLLTDPGEDLLIAPAASDTLWVTFAPTSLGIKESFLAIYANTEEGYHEIPLLGRGIGPLQPPCVEGFEEGWVDWIAVNGTQTNKWTVSSSVPYREDYSIYISADGGVNNTYNLYSSSYTHFYHDVVFPADMDGMQLLFNWRCFGEPGYDYLSVHITDNTFVPVAGEQFSEGLIASYSGEADWQREVIALNPAWAGQTKRLIFSWHNDGGGGSQTPAALDNIRFHSGYTPLDAPLNVLGYYGYTGPEISWDVVPDALDYIIESADMFDGAFSYEGCSGNPVWTLPEDFSRRFFRVRATD